MGKKRVGPSRKEVVNLLDKLPWKSSLPTDDPFSFFAGSDNLEGGSSSFYRLFPQLKLFNYHNYILARGGGGDTSFATEMCVTKIY